MNDVATRGPGRAGIPVRRAGRRPRTFSPVAPWVLTAPALAVSILVLLVPIGYTVVLSLTKARIAGGLIGKKEQVFVGGENYADVLGDPEFWAGIQRMLHYGAIYAPIVMIGALTFALIIDALDTRLARFARLALFLPFAVPGVVSAVMWGFLYVPALSPAGEVLRAVGLPAPSFFGPEALFGSLANIGVWGSIGFNTVLLYTALRTIPGELMDAAKVDGAGPIRTAVSIKLPMILPAVVLTTIFALIGTLQVFTEPQLLRPLTTSISTTFMPMMGIYNRAFTQGDSGGAAAGSIVLALLTLVGSLIVLALSRRRNGASR